MGWRQVLLCLSSTLTLAESSSRSLSKWSINLGAEHSFIYNWTIFSASFCVLVALVLSMYLIFEHLSAYNQPEVLLIVCLHPLFLELAKYSGLGRVKTGYFRIGWSEPLNCSNIKMFYCEIWLILYSFQ